MNPVPWLQMTNMISYQGLVRTFPINVDIDHKRWNGVTVTPKDTVEIQGEVDKDWNSVEIDVKQIRKVNP